MRSPRLYSEFAHWWPLFSPPAEYLEEAEDLLARLNFGKAGSPATLLELGAGGGSLAFHLKRRFSMTLTDISPPMLAVSEALNPECEHLTGDMRSLRLNRLFDAVLIHDAISCATDPLDVAATLRTAATHCRADGTIAVLPDCLKETFSSSTHSGGGDAADGSGLRYLEWKWDPDPLDETYVVDYSLLLRAAGGGVSVVHDRHLAGLFSRASWMRWFRAAGLVAQSAIDPWGREIFIARHADARAGSPAR